MNNPIKIFLVEDQAAYREVISLAIAQEADMDLVSQFGTAEIALRKAQNLLPKDQPDLILLDINLPSMKGLEAIPWFKEYLPESKIIILTESNKEDDVLSAITLGTSGYLRKSASAKQIKDGIRVVMAGGASLDPAVAQFILKTMEKKTITKHSDIELTERELEILSELGEGLDHNGISNKLHISRHTVAFHIKNIYKKLEVPNAPAAVSKAYRRGLLSTKESNK